MKKTIAIIGHVDHGKTTLTAAIMDVLNNTKKDTKTIHEIIEDQNSIPFTAPTKIELMPSNFKNGRESRNERRAKERKKKK